MRLLILGLLAAVVMGCGGGHADVQCQNNANCDLSGGGECVAATTGHMWCAYPDPNCSSGYRYSNQDVGDGLGGVCVAGGGSGDGGLNTHRLTVMVGGSGSGSVTSAPPGLTCSGGTCTADFDDGTSVALTATASSGTFLGWSNDCTGAGACDVVMDHDRVVTALFGIPGEALWSQQIGGAGEDYATAITSDGSGDIIVAGTFNGSFNVGSTTLTSAGGADVFLAKLSGADGSVKWIKSFGTTNDDAAADVVVDGSNNIYLAGSFWGTLTFGSNTLQTAGNVDGFLIKFDTNGNYTWGKSFGGQFGDYGAAVGLTGTTVVVLGNFGTPSVYLATYSTDGTAGWTKTITGNVSAVGLAVDTSGNINVAGSFGGTTNFGGGNVSSTGNTDAFVAKYGPTGTYLVARSFGAANQREYFNNVAVDPAGNVILVGTFQGSVALGGASPFNAGNGQMLVAKYSSAGAYDWALGYAGGPTTSQQAIGNGLSVNSAGDIVVGGYFCGSVAFGSKTLSSVGTCTATDFDIFAVRLSGTDGSTLAATRAGGSSQDQSRRVTQTADGRHFVAGAFQGFADFGGMSRTSAGGNDAIVLALAPL